jgi:hypothetical protein
MSLQLSGRDRHRLGWYGVTLVWTKPELTPESTRLVHESDASVIHWNNYARLSHFLAPAN